MGDSAIIAPDHDTHDPKWYATEDARGTTLKHRLELITTAGGRGRTKGAATLRRRDRQKPIRIFLLQLRKTLWGRLTLRQSLEISLPIGSIRHKSGSIITSLE